MFTLKNQVFIVTGAGSGMGRQLTLLLIAKGAQVAGCDINAKTLEETKALAYDPTRFRTYVLDISDAEKVAAFPKTVKADFGALHGVINNAGIIQPFTPFMKLSQGSIDRVLSINFFGVVNMTRAVIQELNPEQDGWVVNVSSMGAYLPVPGQGIYGASKAAVKLFTESLYGEMKNTKIHVSVVFPGAIATNIIENSKNKQSEVTMHAKKGAKHRMTSPEDAAKVILRGIEKGKLKIFIGSDAKLMDKLSRYMPIKSINMMAKLIYKMME